MFEVTFKGPVRVNAEMLSTLLSLTDQPATVVPIQNGVEVEAPRRGRKPKGEVVEVAPVEEDVVVADPKSNGSTVAGAVPDPVDNAPKKRGRKSNAEKAAAAAQAAGGSAGAETNSAADSSAVESGSAAVSDLVPPPAELMNRFTALVDQNYDAALQLLENFGVGKFSAIPAERHDAFANALAQLGV